MVGRRRGRFVSFYLFFLGVFFPINKWRHTLSSGYPRRRRQDPKKKKGNKKPKRKETPNIEKHFFFKVRNKKTKQKKQKKTLVSSLCLPSQLERVERERERVAKEKQKNIDLWASLQHAATKKKNRTQDTTARWLIRFNSNKSYWLSRNTNGTHTHTHTHTQTHTHTHTHREL